MNYQIKQALQAGKALKVISGLNNYDQQKVAMIVQAAQAGGATYVDIAAQEDLVRFVRNLIQLPICVSAVDPIELFQAVKAGADLVEIGNFDCFYQQGRTFSADEVLELTRETCAMLPETTLSVTVPHILALDEQVQLAQSLVENGADIIQTEGGTSSQPTHAGILGLIEKAAPTIAAAYAISKAVSVPVLCASGLSEVTVGLAIASGASGVGVGSAINRLNDPIAMIAAVRGLVEALKNSQLSRI